MMASVLQKLPLQVKHRGLAKLLAAKPNAEVLTENQCQRWVRALLMLIFYFLPSISSCRLFLGHPQKLVYCEKGKHWKPVSEMQGFNLTPRSFVKKVVFVLNRNKFEADTDSVNTTGMYTERIVCVLLLFSFWYSGPL